MDGQQLESIKDLLHALIGLEISLHFSKGDIRGSFCGKIKLVNDEIVCLMTSTGLLAVETKIIHAIKLEQSSEEVRRFVENFFIKFGQDRDSINKRSDRMDYNSRLNMIHSKLEERGIQGAPKYSDI